VGALRAEVKELEAALEEEVSRWGGGGWANNPGVGADDPRCDVAEEELPGPLYRPDAGEGEGAACPQHSGG
jgi:hypothetical protein